MFVVRCWVSSFATIELLQSRMSAALEAAPITRFHVGVHGCPSRPWADIRSAIPECLHPRRSHVVQIIIIERALSSEPSLFETMAQAALITGGNASTIIIYVDADCSVKRVGSWAAKCKGNSSWMAGNLLGLG